MRGKFFLFYFLLVFVGIAVYAVFKHGKNDYVVKAQLSNGKSVNYEIEFTWNKKENKIYLSARNG